MFFSFVNRQPWSGVLLILLVNLIAWYLLPIQLLVFYQDNLVLDVPFFLKNNTFIFVFCTTVFLALFAGIYRILKLNAFAKYKAGLLKFINGCLIFIISWIILSGYFFPLIKSTGGMTSLSDLPTNVLNLFLVAVLSLGITFLVRSPKIGKIALTMLVALFLITIPAGMSELMKRSSASLDNQERVRQATLLSPHRNLLVISFDGLPGNIVNDIFEQNPEIRNEFRDFIHYNNAISASPGTFSSITNELFGNINLRKITDNEEEFKKTLPLGNLFINKGKKKGVHIVTYGPYNAYNQDGGIRLYSLVPGRAINHIYDNVNLIGSEWSRIVSGEVSGYLMKRVQPRLIDFFNLFLNRDYKYYHHKGPSWDRENLLSNDDFQSLVNNLHISDTTDTLAVKYLHFLHTHFPVDFDKDGNYRSNDFFWHVSHQNYHGLYNQTYYALHQFIDLIKKLKALGVYNNTFLVFKSDHGSITSFFSKSPFNFRINGHNRFGYSRYRPLLLIKDAGRHDSAVTEVSKMVVLGDLANTIETRFGQNRNSNGMFPGLDLIQPDHHTPSPEIYLNVVKDSTCDWRFDTHNTIVVDRSESDSFLEILKHSDLVTLSGGE